MMMYQQEEKMERRSEGFVEQEIEGQLEDLEPRFEPKESQRPKSKSLHSKKSRVSAEPFVQPPWKI